MGGSQRVCNPCAANVCEMPASKQRFSTVNGMLSSLIKEKVSDNSKSMRSQKSRPGDDWGVLEAAVSLPAQLKQMLASPVNVLKATSEMEERASVTRQSSEIHDRGTTAKVSRARKDRQAQPSLEQVATKCQRGRQLSTTASDVLQVKAEKRRVENGAFTSEALSEEFLKLQQEGILLPKRQSRTGNSKSSHRRGSRTSSGENIDRQRHTEQGGRQQHSGRWRSRKAEEAVAADKTFSFDQ